jgi:hypothetical protein
MTSLEEMTGCKVWRYGKRSTENQQVRRNRIKLNYFRLNKYNCVLSMNGHKTVSTVIPESSLS